MTPDHPGNCQARSKSLHGSSRVSSAGTKRNSLAKAAYLACSAQPKRLQVIGRNWAGAHYFTDYIESQRTGEQIALGILEEHMFTYRENFSMTVPLFDGGCVSI